MSTILNQAAARQSAAPAQNPVVTCNTRKVELNQLRNDVNTKQNEVESCDPAEKATRLRNQYIQQNADFINRLWPEFTSLEGQFFSKIEDADSLIKAIGPLESYNKEMDDELKALREKEKNFLHEERYFRRTFLDNSPQEGVAGIVFQHTSDDKVLLLFWVCYLVGIASLVAMGMNVYGSQLGSKSTQIQTGVCIVLIAWGFAYYCITKFG